MKNSLISIVCSFLTFELRNGKLIQWGDSTYLGDDLEFNLGAKGWEIENFVSNEGAYALALVTGEVITGGNETSGGDSSSVAGILAASGKVESVAATDKAFAVVKDGMVVTWGSGSEGGDSSTVADLLGEGVVKVFATGGAFAALKNDDTVVTWGNNATGGDSTSVLQFIQEGIKDIYSNKYAFAAVNKDKNLAVWGDSTYGGSGPIESLKIDTIASTDTAFAAVTVEGKVQAWGDRDNGGEMNGDQQAQLKSGVISIASTSHAFAALKSNGIVYTWGDSNKGGNSSSLRSSLGEGPLGRYSGVHIIRGNKEAFVAAYQKTNGDGSVEEGIISWGSEAFRDSQLSEPFVGVKDIFANDFAFVIELLNGKLLPIGFPNFGGSLPSDSILISGENLVDRVYSYSKGFFTVLFNACKSVLDESKEPEFCPCGTIPDPLDDSKCTLPEDAVEPKKTCPEGAVMSTDEEYCYIFGKDETTFNSAFETCWYYQDSALPSILDNEEHDYISGFVMRKLEVASRIWLPIDWNLIGPESLTRLDDFDNWYESNVLWADGTPLTKEIVADNIGNIVRKDSNGNDTCIYLDSKEVVVGGVKKKNKWHSASCDVEGVGFICKSRPLKETCEEGYNFDILTGKCYEENHEKPICPAGWDEARDGRRCFKLFNDQEVSFSAAQEQCVAAGKAEGGRGSLVSILEKKDEEYVNGLVTDSNKCWIGVPNNQQNFWISGSNVVAHRFPPEVPVDSGCGVLQGDEKWTRLDCNITSLNFICEMEKVTCAKRGFEYSPGAGKCVSNVAPELENYHELLFCLDRVEKVGGGKERVSEILDYMSGCVEKHGISSVISGFYSDKEPRNWAPPFKKLARDIRQKYESDRLERTKRRLDEGDDSSEIIGEPGWKWPNDFMRDARFRAAANEVKQDAYENFEPSFGSYTVLPLTGDLSAFLDSNLPAFRACLVGPCACGFYRNKENGECVKMEDNLSPTFRLELYTGYARCGMLKQSELEEKLSTFPIEIFFSKSLYCLRGLNSEFSENKELSLSNELIARATQEVVKVIEVVIEEFGDSERKSSLLELAGKIGNNLVQKPVNELSIPPYALGFIKDDVEKMAANFKSRANFDLQVEIKKDTDDQLKKQLQNLTADLEGAIINIQTETSYRFEDILKDFEDDQRTALEMINENIGNINENLEAVVFQVAESFKTVHEQFANDAATTIAQHEREVESLTNKMDTLAYGINDALANSNAEAPLMQTALDNMESKMREMINKWNQYETEKGKAGRRLGGVKILENDYSVSENVKAVKIVKAMYENVGSTLNTFADIVGGETGLASLASVGKTSRRTLQETAAVPSHGIENFRHAHKERLLQSGCSVNQENPALADTLKIEFPAKSLPPKSGTVVSTKENRIVQSIRQLRGKIPVSDSPFLNNNTVPEGPLSLYGGEVVGTYSESLDESIESGLSVVSSLISSISLGLGGVDGSVSDGIASQTLSSNQSKTLDTCLQEVQIYECSNSNNQNIVVSCCPYRVYGVGLDSQGAGIFNKARTDCDTLGDSSNLDGFTCNRLASIDEVAEKTTFDVDANTQAYAKCEEGQENQVAVYASFGKTDLFRLSCCGIVSEVSADSDPSIVQVLNQCGLALEDDASTTEEVENFFRVKISSLFSDENRDGESGRRLSSTTQIISLKEQARKLSGSSCGRVKRDPVESLKASFALTQATSVRNRVSSSKRRVVKMISSAFSRFQKALAGPLSNLPFTPTNVLVSNSVTHLEETITKLQNGLSDLSARLLEITADDADPNTLSTEGTKASSLPALWDSIYNEIMDGLEYSFGVCPKLVIKDESRRRMDSKDDVADENTDLSQADSKRKLIGERLNQKIDPVSMRRSMGGKESDEEKAKKKAKENMEKYLKEYFVKKHELYGFCEDFRSTLRQLTLWAKAAHEAMNELTDTLRKLKLTQGSLLDQQKRLQDAEDAMRAVTRIGELTIDEIKKNPNVELPPAITREYPLELARKFTRPQVLSELQLAVKDAMFQEDVLQMHFAAEEVLHEFCASAYYADPALKDLQDDKDGKRFGDMCNFDIDSSQALEYRGLSMYDLGERLENAANIVTENIMGLYFKDGLATQLEARLDVSEMFNFEAFKLTSEGEFDLDGPVGGATERSADEEGAAFERGGPYFCSSSAKLDNVEMTRIGMLFRDEEGNFLGPVVDNGDVDEEIAVEIRLEGPFSKTRNGKNYIYNLQPFQAFKFTYHLPDAQGNCLTSSRPALGGKVCLGTTQDQPDSTQQIMPSPYAHWKIRVTSGLKHLENIHTVEIYGNLRGVKNEDMVCRPETSQYRMPPLPEFLLNETTAQPTTSPTTPPSAKPTETSDDGGLGPIIGASAGGVVVLGAIAFYVLRKKRSNGVIDETGSVSSGNPEYKKVDAVAPNAA